MLNNRWIVLVGGGACGEWPAGALESIEAARLLKGISGIVGTSVGGLNACVLALGLSRGEGVTLLKQAWDSIQKDEDVYTPSVPKLQASPWQNAFSILGVAKNFVWGPGAVDRTALENLTLKFLGDATTDEIKQITGIDVLVRAYKYKAGQVHSLQGSLRDMALATSAIEGAFPSWQGYGDGGAGDNAPIDVALSRGAKQILVIYCSPDDPKSSDTPVILGPVGNQTHTTGISNILAVAENITKDNENLVAQAAASAAKNGVELIECYPSSDTGNFLDFKKRGLWERGKAESLLAIQAAIALGWDKP